MLRKLKELVRDALASIFFSIAPRFKIGLHSMPFGVNLVGYAHAEMGLGEVLRTSAAALKWARIPYAVRRLNIPLLNRQENFSLSADLAETCDYPVNCIGINPDLLLWLPKWLNYNEWGCRYNIGYWFWELANFPRQWRYACKMVDEVWANTDFIVNAVKQSHPNVWKIPFAVEFGQPDTRFDRSYFNLPNVGFLFLFSYDFNSSSVRKNPEAVVRAFKKAFPDTNEPVYLVVKSINGFRQPERMAEVKASLMDDPRIIWIDHYLSTEEMRGLLNTADCYVSLHRAEGLGLGLAESMYLGKPVIATAYSGNLEFMNEMNSLLVPYQLVGVKPDEYHFGVGQQWADPDVGYAADCMRNVFDEPKLRAEIGANAQAHMKQYHSLQVVSQAVAARLATIKAML